MHEWLSKPEHKLVIYPAEILRQETKSVKEVDVATIAQIMFRIMYEHRGVGLAGPQVGLPYQIFVMNSTGDREQKDKEHILINPQITSYSERKTTSLEGCLSIPKLFANVERPHTVLLEAMIDGKPTKTQYSGATARIAQHEIDHLRGILFIDRISTEERNELLKTIPGYKS